MSRKAEDARRLLWVNQVAIAPADGGGTRHVEIGRELRALGWHVTIAASDFHFLRRAFTRRQSAQDRAPIVETNHGPAIVWLWAAPYARNDWRRMLNWITFAMSLLRHKFDDERPHIVVGSSPPPLAALGAELLARRLGVPFVLEVRDIWPESLVAAGGRRGIAYHGLAAIARYLYRRADRIIVLARGTADYLVEHFDIPRDRIAFVPNGVDLELFTRNGDAQPSRAAFTIGYAGAHGPANGLDVVLDAAELLAKRGDAVRFMLLGDGPSKAALVHAARARGIANVEFCDPVPKQQMPAFLAGCDAGLMILRPDPLFEFGVSPNKLFDYFGASLPVVCTVPGEVAQIVADAEAGVQTRDASAEALADAVRRLAAVSGDDRKTMGRSGRAWVERENSRPALAGALDRCLTDLVR